MRGNIQQRAADGHERFGTHADRGFSMIEVVLALGVVAFGIIAVIGLLPVSLAAQRESIDQSAAIQVLRVVSASMWSAHRVGTVHRPSFPLEALSYQSAETAVWEFGWDGKGQPRTDAAVWRTDPGVAYSVVVDFVAPDGGKPGFAYLGVAWPSSARYSKGSGWSGQIGNAETSIYFNDADAN